MICALWSNTKRPKKQCIRTDLLWFLYLFIYFYKVQIPFYMQEQILTDDQQLVTRRSYIPSLQAMSSQLIQVELIIAQVMSFEIDSLKHWKIETYRGLSFVNDFSKNTVSFEKSIVMNPLSFTSFSFRFRWSRTII